MIYLYLFGTCFHFIYVFMIIGKYLFRSKLVFVESAAMVVQPSKTGRAIYKYCDLFLIQWESLRKFYPNAKFVGIL